jgi:nicotinamidase-related amidase
LNTASQSARLIGLRANTCIESTSRFAMQLGYHVTLLAKDANRRRQQRKDAPAHELNGPSFAHRSRRPASCAS